MEQPAIVTATEVADKDPARDRTEASTPTRGDETAGTPPPSSVTQEEDKAPSPIPVEEGRAPTPALVEAPTLGGTSDRGKGPMIPVTMVGGNTELEDTQALTGASPRWSPTHLRMAPAWGPLDRARGDRRGRGGGEGRARC